MNQSPGNPPRFVPTLTEVVDELAPSSPVPAPDEQSHQPVLQQGLPALRGMPVIPRNLPPLPDSLPPQPSLSVAPGQANAVETPIMAVAPQDPVQPASDENSAGNEDEDRTEAPQSASGPTAETVEPLADEPIQELEEDLSQRLMQQVDLLLEQRLKSAIAALLQEQLDALAPRLHEQVQTTVRQLVQEAVQAQCTTRLDAPKAEDAQDR